MCYDKLRSGQSPYIPCRKTHYCADHKLDLFFSGLISIGPYILVSYERAVLYARVFISMDVKLVFYTNTRYPFYIPQCSP